MTAHQPFFTHTIPNTPSYTHIWTLFWVAHSMRIYNVNKHHILKSNKAFLYTKEQEFNYLHFVTYLKCNLQLVVTTTLCYISKTVNFIELL